MDRFLKLKIPLIIVIAAFGWAFVADPLISHLAQRLEPGHRDLFRSLNDFTVLVLVSLTLYRRISRQAREMRKTRDDYRRLFEEVPVPMFIFDSRDFRFLAVNTAASVHYGYSKTEFLEMKITDIRRRKKSRLFWQPSARFRTATQMRAAGCTAKRTATRFTYASIPTIPSLKACRPNKRW